MANEGARKSSTGFQWDQLVKAAKGFPIPENDPLYALPLRLIEALRQTGFLTNDETDFEVALASTSGGVFVNRRAYWSKRHRFLNMQFLLSDDFNDGLASELQQARLDEVGRFRERDDSWFDQNMANIFGTRGKAAAMRKMRDEFEVFDRQTRIAYSGWLVTNAQFQEEFAQLRAAAPPSVGRQGKFPVLTLASERNAQFLSRYTRRIWLPRDEAARGFQKQCDEFFIRWCCESLFDWNIPVPMRILLGFPMSYASNAWLAGIPVFIPWYAFKDRELDLRRLMDLDRAQLCGEHLDSWVRKGNKNLGKRQFAKIFRLYVYLELAIRCRYRERVQGRLDDIDRVFHRFFHSVFQSGKPSGLDVDSVKKLRQRLGRSRGGRIPPGQTSVAPTAESASNC